MKEKKTSRLSDFLLTYPERILIAVGLIFLGIMIFVCLFWYEDGNARVSADRNIVLPTYNEEGSVIIDINTADKADFCLLPGIDTVLADRILEYRDKHGKFTSVDDLSNVNGIGEKKIEEIRYYVVCSSEEISSH